MTTVPLISAIRAKRALVVSPVPPEHDRESGSRRMFHLVEMLASDGWMVTYVAERAVDGARYLRALRQMGVETLVGSHDVVEGVVAEREYDVAVLIFWEVAERYLPALRRLSPSTRVVVDTVDLHFVREARGAYQRRGQDPVGLLAAERGLDYARELNAYAAADAVLTVSGKEARLIDDLLAAPSHAFAVPDLEELPVSEVERADRRGILFLGNFRHAPNADAVEFLLDEIVPRIPEHVLAEHPVSIVGNGAGGRVLARASAYAHVDVVGWVPRVLPYLHQALLAVVPLRYGAGTKRKVVQALSVGTPVVTTSIGAEGMELVHARHAMIADLSTDFADAAQQVVEDDALWRHLAAEGMAHVAQRHSPEVAQRALRTALGSVLARRARPAALLPAEGSAAQQLLAQISADVAGHLPAGCVVAVVSKGDDELLQLPDVCAQHFPTDEHGHPLGYHPATSTDAIRLLERARENGADYLLFPEYTRWWLDHYTELQHHLVERYTVVSDSDACTILDLRPRLSPSSRAVMSAPTATVASPHQAAAGGSAVACARPLARHRPADHAQTRGAVLVVGVFVVGKDSHAESVVRAVASTAQWSVEQRWVGLGGAADTDVLHEVTTAVATEPRPKFSLLNEVLADLDVDAYDYVVVVDDDILVPDGFLDAFLDAQERLGFALAQPARTANSYIDHPIVEQQPFTARQTRFVEIGPVFSLHRSAAAHLLPFDEASPMGWGYENVWAARLTHAGLTMGIVDAVPVDHSLRAPVAHYSWGEADEQRRALLSREPHLPMGECQRLLAVADSGVLDLQSIDEPATTPEITVVIPTRDRAELLAASLGSLVAQSLETERFEVVVVDDGSADETRGVCSAYASRLALRSLHVAPKGIAVAKNLGLFAARAPIVLFFDDDDVADPQLLSKHLATHRSHPANDLAVLGRTTWHASLEVTPLMRYVTDVGCYLFAYPHLDDGDVLDYRHFWGGRSSCKRAFLLEHGIFDQDFVFGCEDVELGYRLARHGLKVVYDAAALSHMARPLDFAAFCARRERQGRSQFHFARKHPCAEVQAYCEVTGADARWREAAPFLREVTAAVEHLELTSADGDRAARAGLHELYRFAFDAYNARGIVRASQEDVGVRSG
jgi:glycosyltransferase involved in cell wall biosynthesis